MEGWRHVWHRWHYFRDGSSLCGKYSVSIIGGGRPRRPWPPELPLDETTQRTCTACLELRKHPADTMRFVRATLMRINTRRLNHDDTIALELARVVLAGALELPYL